MDDIYLLHRPYDEVEELAAGEAGDHAESPRSPGDGRDPATYGGPNSFLVGAHVGKP